ncbi:tetratricopeptide repeat protein 5, partial [Passer montanus]|uniref:tetratricopeptide repeat protein 5 n=1 Tax=Passer montanus TaxID=9160 RepID=UPI00195FCC15
MEQIHVSPEGRGRALVLRARALGVAPEVGGARAEQALGHALKLDPALGVAWRQLGEQRWRRGDLRGAQEAFGGALRQVGGAWQRGRGLRKGRGFENGEG